MNSLGLSAFHLTKHYFISRGLFRKRWPLKALNDVSFQVLPRRTLAVVGESGSGKTTLAKVLMGLELASSGHVVIDGEAVQLEKPIAHYKRYVEKIQMIFQDPRGSLNPRKKVWELVSEPLLVHGSKGGSRGSPKGLLEEAALWMERVGLPSDLLFRYPHMLSGGQCQRVGIARSLVLRPKVLICDEPVSSLDVSVQAQVMNLLQDIQDAFGLSYLFISHDLSLVRYFADEVMVLYLGEVMEHAHKEELFIYPKHPYTRALLASIPEVGCGPEDNGPKDPPIVGEMPSLIHPLPGCLFHTRCPLAQALCRKEKPRLRHVEQGASTHRVACHFAD